MFSSSVPTRTDVPATIASGRSVLSHDENGLP